MRIFPIDDPRWREVLRRDILDIHLKDNVQSRRLLPDGNYERLKAGKEPELNSQQRMLDMRGTWHNDGDQ